MAEKEKKNSFLYSILRLLYFLSGSTKIVHHYLSYKEDIFAIILIKKATEDAKRNRILD